MPPSSRKRNKGKERKAKQQAKKEENERAIIHGIWTGYCSSTTGCNHGHEIVIPSDDHPVSSFMDQFFVNFHTISTSQNLVKLFETHRHIWNNESYRKLVVGILIKIGTNMMLGKASEMSWPACVAQSIILLENYYGNGTNDLISVMHSRIVRLNWRDLSTGVSSIRRDALKFYRKRTTCKCLKKMHLEARKSTQKMGECYYCKEEKERSLLCVCSRCMLDQYCSRKCQVADWSIHEIRCDTFVSARKKQMEEENG